MVGGGDAVVVQTTALHVAVHFPVHFHWVPLCQLQLTGVRLTKLATLCTSLVFVNVLLFPALSLFLFVDAVHTSLLLIGFFVFKPKAIIETILHFVPRGFFPIDNQHILSSKKPSLDPTIGLAEIPTTSGQFDQLIVPVVLPVSVSQGSTICANSFKYLS